MNWQSIFTPETRFPVNPDVPGFPFERELSLAPLVAAWCGETAPGAPDVAASLAAVVRDAVCQTPELTRPIEDLAVIGKHRALVDVLMGRVFPAAFWEQDYAAAVPPFHLRAFYATPSFERLLLGEDGRLRGTLNLDEQTLAAGRLVRAWDLVLRRYHGVSLGFDYPIILTVEDPDSGLDRHFRLEFDGRFIDVEATGPVRTLTPEEKVRLLANLADPTIVAELIPPAQFRFRGFGVLKAIDVTDQEVLSALKRDLIEKESIVSANRFQKLQHELRTLFRRPGLRLALAAIQGEQVFMLNYGCRLEHACIFADSTHRRRRDFADSVYERAVQQGSPLIVEDLQTYPQRSAVEDAILSTGIRNIVIAPLYYQDQLIGALDLGSPHPGDLNAMNALKLRDVLPLFSMAVKRSLDELETRVQTIIKEKCTAIHPAVEWRFRRAVLDGIERRANPGSEMEPIVFKDVFPLYGASDIRGSSTQRNLAIQADLIAHLGLARDVADAARQARHLPILDELRYRLDRLVRQSELGLGSGDEVTMLAFLRGEVEPLFDHIAAFSAAVQQRIEAYRAALDPRFGTVYRQRRDYEESVALINETIASYLDAEQEMAQGMFPHYFERQRTDGVDYSIYVGASLVESGVFDELYLRNLRLWQLMVTCGIARRAEAVRRRLPVPLDTTHLVLVQHASLAIRFRFDEKRFDVDGAYNVRYEVVKKRIDKAVVKGTGERVTQPGKLAIVYSQPREAVEYRQYLDYLGASGYLAGEVEELELEELQGVQGLRALRVPVDLTAPEPRSVTAEAAEAVRTLGR